jgi:hypothetical protein
MRPANTVYAEIDADECGRIAAVLMRAGRLLADFGQPNLGSDLVKLAAMFAAVAVASPSERRMITLTEWRRRHRIPATTATRWARTGKLPGARPTPYGWLVPDDCRPWSVRRTSRSTPRFAAG